MSFFKKLHFLAPLCFAVRCSAPIIFAVRFLAPIIFAVRFLASIIFAVRFCRPLTFHTELNQRIHVSKYQRFTLSGCQDIGIRVCGRNSVSLFKFRTNTK